MLLKLVNIFLRGFNKLSFKYTNKFYRRHLKHIGKNTLFTHRVEFINPYNITIGDNSYINGGMIVAGRNSSINIGNNCLISYNVHIRTTSHNHQRKDMLIREQGEFEADINIKDNVWIGFGVQILPGVSIGENSIIGAGAVVTKSLPPNGIYGGIPAKLIKER